VGVLALIRIFQGRTVEVLTDGSFDDAAGDRREVVVFALA
jgi:hypothetical protein